MKNHIIIVIILATISMIACKPKATNTTTEESSSKAKIKRYEIALSEINWENTQKLFLDSLQKDFPLFLGGADLRDTQTLLQLKGYATDPIIMDLTAQIKTTYPNLSSIEGQVYSMFKRAKELFPSFSSPQLCSFVSYLDFPNRVVYIDSILAIGLDLYLGENNIIYNTPTLPKYLHKRMDSNFILSDIARVIAEHFIAPPSSDLLSMMIYQGKLLCCIDYILPDEKDKFKIGYQEQDLDWCNKNEGEIWKHLTSQNLLYESDLFKIKSFIGEGPGNNPFVGCPSRLGHWVGWQIGKKYLKKEDIQNLIQETNAQTVLSVSGYKPR